MKTILKSLLAFNICSFVYAVDNREKIVIVDTGYNVLFQNHFQCNENLNLDLTHTTLQDKLNHGELINEILANKLDTKKYCIVNIKYKAILQETGVSQRIITAFRYISTLSNVRYINYSSGGDGYFLDEYKYIKKFTNEGIKVFVSAGNDGKELKDNNTCDYYPACYRYLNNNFYVVGGLLNDKVWNQSNFGILVKYWEKAFYYSFRHHAILFGTSFAAPYYLKRFLK